MYKIVGSAAQLANCILLHAYGLSMYNCNSQQCVHKQKLYTFFIRTS